MHAAHGRIEKRNRPPVSCEPCRTRKLKCNRELPCDSCLKRDRSSSCHFAANAVRSSKPPTTKSKDFRDRLDTLEDLVSSFLSHAAAKPAPPRAAPVPPALARAAAQGGAEKSEAPHMVEADEGHVSYVDPSHWLSILDDIREVREHLAPAKSAASEPSREDGSRGVGSAAHDADLLLGGGPAATLNEVLRALPPQATCDVLLSWYFGLPFMVLGIIHPSKFRAEYESFWDAPSTAPPLWLALLFSVLGLSASLRQAFHSTPAPDDQTPAPRRLQVATSQCLRLGRYTTANAHALECILLHLQSCFFSHTLSTTSLWFGMGTLLRLALRMGYNRDPDRLAGLTPFDGEMRRRVWLNIVQIDALWSFQTGLPSMVPAQFCDARKPGNYEDSDLAPGMASLPRERPLSERTPVRYALIKAGVMDVFRKITAHTQALSVPAYDETLSLEAELRRVYAGIPESHRRRDVKRAFTDPAGLILERTTIELLYLKGLIVLNRRYIAYDDVGEPFEPSRRSCVEAALDMLARQADIHRACEPGGRLFDDRWLFFSMAMHDFLLAAMVVCMDLSVRLRSAAVAGSPEEMGHGSLVEQEYQALQTSKEVWARHMGTSSETRIAAQAVDVMMRKVAESRPLMPGRYPSPSTTAYTATPSTDSGAQLLYEATMSQMIDGSESVDWALLDQCFQNVHGPSSDFNWESTS